MYLHLENWFWILVNEATNETKYNQPELATSIAFNFYNLWINSTFQQRPLFLGPKGDRSIQVWLYTERL